MTRYLKTSDNVFISVQSWRLRPWQMIIMNRLFTCQTTRHVLWVVDTIGNSRKTCLAELLDTAYGYLRLDGTASPHDMTLLFDVDCSGFVIDVSRSAQAHVNYSAIEGIKSGLLTSYK